MKKLSNVVLAKKLPHFDLKTTPKELCSENQKQVERRKMNNHYFSQYQKMLEKYEQTSTMSGLDVGIHFL